MDTRKQNQSHYYEILQLEDTATLQEIKKNYHRLALIHHPDKGGDPEKFKQILEAYAALSETENKHHANTLESTNKSKIVFIPNMDDILSDSTDHFHTIFKKEMKNQQSEFKHVDNDKAVKPEIANQTIFYLVGTPIPIKEKTQKSFFPLIGSNYQFREIIPSEEIKQSYPSEGSTMLFLKLKNAIQYARATRTTDIDKNKLCSQSCVFTVKCLSILNQDLLKSGVIKINEKKHQSRTNIYFFEIDIKNVIPLQGQLVIQRDSFISTNKQYPSYPSIKFEGADKFALSDPDNRSVLDTIDDISDQCLTM